MKNLHHILGVPRRLLIPTPVYKEADNKVLEEVLVITFCLMAGQTSVIKGDTNTLFGFGKNSYIGELLQFKQRNLSKAYSDATYRLSPFEISLYFFSD